MQSGERESLRKKFNDQGRYHSHTRQQRRSGFYFPEENGRRIRYNDTDKLSLPFSFHALVTTKNAVEFTWLQDSQRLIDSTSMYEKSNTDATLKKNFKFDNILSLIFFI